MSPHLSSQLLGSLFTLHLPKRSGRHPRSGWPVGVVGDGEFHRLALLGGSPPSRLEKVGDTTEEGLHTFRLVDDEHHLQSGLHLVLLAKGGEAFPVHRTATDRSHVDEPIFRGDPKTMRRRRVWILRFDNVGRQA